MKRLVDTSVGRVLIDFYGDGVLQVTLLDEAGWEVREGEWRDAEAGRGLFYVAGVPEDEAQRIGCDVMAEWEARSGSPVGAGRLRDQPRRRLALPPSSSA